MTKNMTYIDLNFDFTRVQPQINDLVVNFNNTITATSETTSTVTSHRLDNMKDVRLLKGDLYSYRGNIILSFLDLKMNK